MSEQNPAALVQALATELARFQARGPRDARPAHERVWARIQIGAPDECWPWQGAQDRKGYGTLKDGRRMVRAHRAAYEATYGSIPEGKLACHTCDNPPCCNPAHLWLGTAGDNIRDAAAKGRLAPQQRPEMYAAVNRRRVQERPETCPRGEQQGGAKLTEASVRVIRSRNASGESQKRLAREYGVSKSLIGQIVRRTAWRHVA